MRRDWICACCRTRATTLCRPPESFPCQHSVFFWSRLKFAGTWEPLQVGDREREGMLHGYEPASAPFWQLGRSGKTVRTHVGNFTLFEIKDVAVLQQQGKIAARHCIATPPPPPRPPSAFLRSSSFLSVTEGGKKTGSSSRMRAAGEKKEK